MIEESEIDFEKYDDLEVVVCEVSDSGIDTENMMELIHYAESDEDDDYGKMVAVIRMRNGEFLTVEAACDECGWGECEDTSSMLIFHPNVAEAMENLSEVSLHLLKGESNE